MDKRQKLAIFLFILSFLMLGYGLTYSIFNSNTTLSSTNLDLASFVFNSENLDQFQLELTDLEPGKNVNYDFSVSNNYRGKKSEITVSYRINLKTYHFIPLKIELYKVKDEQEELVLTCEDEETRLDNNQIKCTTDAVDMDYNIEILDDYRIKVIFDEKYNSDIYADLVDFVDIEIESWQKLGA